MAWDETFDAGKCSQGLSILMGTYEELQLKHEHRNEREKDSIAIICRGKSFDYLLENPDRLNLIETIVMVNEWTTQPEAFLRMFSTRSSLVNYLTDMPMRGCVGFMENLKLHGRLDDIRSTALLKKYRKENPECFLPESKAFVRAWAGKDTGLRCIITYSLMSRYILVVGMDFWEASYWNIDDDVHKTKLGKGSNTKTRVQMRLLDWIEFCSGTKFVFITYSKSFKERASHRRLFNLLIVSPDDL